MPRVETTGLTAQPGFTGEVQGVFLAVATFRDGVLQALRFGDDVSGYCTTSDPAGALIRSINHNAPKENIHGA